VIGIEAVAVVEMKNERVCREEENLISLHRLWSLLVPRCDSAPQSLPISSFEGERIRKG